MMAKTAKTKIARDHLPKTARAKSPNNAMNGAPSDVTNRIGNTDISVGSRLERKYSFPSKYGLATRIVAARIYTNLFNIFNTN